jgi:hypothetical protein
VKAKVTHLIEPFALRFDHTTQQQLPPQVHTLSKALGRVPFSRHITGKHHTRKWSNWQTTQHHVCRLAAWHVSYRKRSRHYCLPGMIAATIHSCTVEWPKCAHVWHNPMKSHQAVCLSDRHHVIHIVIVKCHTCRVLSWSFLWLD